MKKLLICSFLFFIVGKTFAQNGEFEIHPNGYIYSESTMDKLAHIVDSLNLKYKTCDLNHKPSGILLNSTPTTSKPPEKI